MAATTVSCASGSRAEDATDTLVGVNYFSGWWTATLKQLKADLAKGVYGFPLPDGVQPAFTIYAWNEFGEGGILAPTRGDGYMKLEGIRAVFGP